MLQLKLNKVSEAPPHKQCILKSKLITKFYWLKPKSWRTEQLIFWVHSKRAVQDFDDILGMNSLTGDLSTDITFAPWVPEGQYCWNMHSISDLRPLRSVPYTVRLASNGKHEVNLFYFFVSFEFFMFLPKDLTLTYSTVLEHGNP